MRRSIGRISFEPIYPDRFCADKAIGSSRRSGARDVKLRQADVAAGVDANSAKTESIWTAARECNFAKDFDRSGSLQKPEQLEKETCARSATNTHQRDLKYGPGHEG
jgi:hypothetical protein